jgi:hypothetical protein
VINHFLVFVALVNRAIVHEQDINI